MGAGQDVAVDQKEEKQLCCHDKGQRLVFVRASEVVRKGNERVERTAQSGAPAHHWAWAPAADASKADMDEVFMMLMGV